MGNRQSTTVRPFNSASTGEQVAQVFAERCKGITVIVTGANTGLGLETSRVLASQGSTVVLCSRNIKNGENAVKKIKDEFPDAQVSAMALDLGSLQSIDKFVKEYASKFSKLDILINNAGVMACPKSLTADGFESQFGVNHLGHFYLTRLLLPLLEKSGTKERPSRVVNLASIAQFLYGAPEGILFDDLNGDKNYEPWQRYGNSKLANVLFSKELQHRFGQKNILAVSLHPGMIMETELSRHMDFVTALKAITGVLARKGGFSVLSEKNKNTKQGTATTILCALDPDVEAGGYYYDCQASKGEKMHPLAADVAQSNRLWEVSEKLVADALKAK